jgi:GrpB-like predicted nucleotidyltransferase (UPF0157 family)
MTGHQHHADSGQGSWPRWATEPVELVDSHGAWADLADGFAGEVRSLFSGWLSSDVVHVGSTAIPGLLAKPVIDLQAAAPDPSAAIAAVGHTLSTARWFLVPRRLDQRPWRWLLVRTDPDAQHRLAHLHLMRPGERRWHDQLVFRDRLRSDPALLTEYAELKASAAAAHQHDREAYTHAKAEFINRVLDPSCDRPARRDI